MIEIRYSDISNIQEKKFRESLKLVPVAMQRELLNYRVFSDRKLSLYGRLLVANFLKFSWGEWKVNAYGKPYLSSGIRFNISHSSNIVIAAFSKCELGIDIERKKDYHVKDILRYLHPLERKYILKCNNKLDAFYYIWTRNEAYLKAIGHETLDNLKNVNCLPDLTENGEYSIITIPFKSSYSVAVCHKVEKNICCKNISIKKIEFL